MPIKVNISLSAGGRLKPVSSHTLHEKRITIGRDQDSTLTLPDTQKHVSRMHAELEEEDGSYWMKVVSKVNPVIVNGRRYTYGNRVPLVDGDQVSVGLYKLEIVEANPAPPAQAAPAPRPRAEPDPSELTYVRPPPKAPPPAQDEVTYVPPSRAVPPAAPSPKPPAPQSMLPDSAALDDEVTYIPPIWARDSRAPGSPTVDEPSPRVDERFEEDLTNIRRPPPAPPVSREPAPVAMVQAPAEVPVPEEPAGELDFDLSEAFDPSEEQTLVRPSPQPEPEEVEEGFSDDVTYVRRPGSMPPLPKRSAAPAYTEADRLAEEETQYRPVARPAAAPPPAVPRSAGPDPGADRAVHAFLEGAGLPDLQIPDPERFMRDSGVMVRAAIEGVMMLLLAREEARKELGAEAEPGADDNPLKSMASPAEVLAFLFDPKRPAIADADPVQAFSDACSDLRAHQVALIAGMRAAVASALRSVDPKRIEREHGVNLGGLNLTRKSKLWDISIAEHEKLAREMEENFSNVFGREILAAYTAQARKMRRGR